MTNEHYQSLFGLDPAAVRERFLRRRARRRSTEFCADIPDDELATPGHRPGRRTTSGSLLDAFAACDAEKDRPSVLFAYTIKGWGLPIAGQPAQPLRAADDQAD